MSRADPNASFQSAVNHLFRHLADVSELRRNPLVKWAFAESASVEATLSLIRTRILEEAHQCQRHDSASGEGATSRRQHAIISALCNGELAEKTAMHLGLSRRQYYRDKSAICARIARALESKPAADRRLAHTEDPLELLINRTASLVACGFSISAKQMLERACSEESGGSIGFALRLELAKTELGLGNVERTLTLLPSLHFSLKQLDKSAASLALCDRLSLLEAAVAGAVGDDALSGAILDQLVSRHAEQHRHDAVAIEALVECAYFHCCDGTYDDARRLAKRARSLTRRHSLLAHDLHVGLSLVEAHSLADITMEVHETVPRYTNALSESLRFGLTRRAVEATVGLAADAFLSGRDEYAYQLSANALQMARSAEGAALSATAGLWVSGFLVQSKYWRSIDPLIFQLDEVIRPGSNAWMLLKAAQGRFFTRSGRVADGALRISEAAQCAENVTCGARVKSVAFRDLGTALYNLGRKEESIAAMRTAVDFAERSGNVRSLSLTYEAASHVLADRKIAREASHLKALVEAEHSQQPVQRRGRSVSIVGPALHRTGGSDPSRDAVPLTL